MYRSSREMNRSPENLDRSTHELVRITFLAEDLALHPASQSLPSFRAGFGSPAYFRKRAFFSSRGSSSAPSPRCRAGTSCSWGARKCLPGRATPCGDAREARRASPKVCYQPPAGSEESRKGSEHAQTGSDESAKGSGESVKGSEESVKGSGGSRKGKKDSRNVSEDSKNACHDPPKVRPISRKACGASPRACGDSPARPEIGASPAKSHQFELCNRELRRIE